MKKLKHIKKSDRYGCTIACLAMISGKSYFEVREAIHQHVPRLKNTWTEPNQIGLYAPEIIDFLKSGLGISSRFIRFPSLRTLKKHCIIFICSLAGERQSGHAIVFDAKTRCIIDPDCIQRNIKNYNVFCCIEIQ